MIGNKYNYLFIDGSYLLTRNLWIATKDKKIEEMNPGSVIKLTIQTINKLYRDWDCAGDKPILIFDEWDKNLGGYYRTYLIRDFVSYKGSRKFITKADLERMRQDPNVTKKELEDAEREVAIADIKFKAKKIMKEEFRKLGIPYFSWPGYEFDDIATLASFQLYGKSDKPNVIVTKDSDLSWSLCPNCCQFLLPTRGSDPVFITYEEMWNKTPEVIRNSGLGLYMYHAYCDSLGVTGHNDNLKTIKPGKDGDIAILKIMAGNYEDVENIDAFKAQLGSFDLSRFPNINDVKNMIENDFKTVGHISNAAEFIDFCKKHGISTENNISGLTESYYRKLAERFDTKLFTE